VWAAAQHTPIMVGKRFFKNQVTDVAWSPDGYTAFACSSDGGCCAALHALFRPKVLCGALCCVVLFYGMHAVVL
jgi:hypothetical protein